MNSGAFSSQLLSAAAILAVALNIVWYAAKSFVKSRGYELHYFWKHWNDIRSLMNIYRTTSDDGDRRKSLMYLAVLLGGLVIFLGAFVAVISSI